MLTANEAFLVREAVREKIETLREAVRHESAKHPTMQDIRTLKHFQAELERYEVAYQKMLNEVGCQVMIAVLKQKEPTSSVNEVSC